jgi:hypothetical protein
LKIQLQIILSQAKMNPPYHRHSKKQALEELK